MEMPSHSGHDDSHKALCRIERPSLDSSEVLEVTAVDSLVECLVAVPMLAASTQASEVAPLVVVAARSMLPMFAPIPCPPSPPRY